MTRETQRLAKPDLSSPETQTPKSEARDPTPKPETRNQVTRESRGPSAQREVGTAEGRWKAGCSSEEGGTAKGRGEAAALMAKGRQSPSSLEQPPLIREQARELSVLSALSMRDAETRDPKFETRNSRTREPSSPPASLEQPPLMEGQAVSALSMGEPRLLSSKEPSVRSSKESGTSPLMQPSQPSLGNSEEASPLVQPSQPSWGNSKEVSPLLSSKESPLIQPSQPSWGNSEEDSGEDESGFDLSDSHGVSPKLDPGPYTLHSRPCTLNP